MVLAKHLCVEPEHLRAGSPGIRRQARLLTGAGQELLTRPTPLGGDLWKQQSSPSTLLDDEAVTTDLDAPRSSGSIRSSGPSTEISMLVDGSSSAVTGGKRGSRAAESSAHRATSPARSERNCSVPRQPRNSPRRLIVTNTPDASGIGSDTPKIDVSPARCALIASRAIISRDCFCASVNIVLGKAAKCSGKVADHAVVVAGNLS